MRAATSRATAATLSSRVRTRMRPIPIAGENIIAPESAGNSRTGEGIPLGTRRYEEKTRTREQDGAGGRAATAGQRRTERAAGTGDGGATEAAEPAEGERNRERGLEGQRSARQRKEGPSAARGGATEAAATAAGSNRERHAERRASDGERRRPRCPQSGEHGARAGEDEPGGAAKGGKRERAEGKEQRAAEEGVAAARGTAGYHGRNIAVGYACLATDGSRLCVGAVLASLRSGRGTLGARRAARARLRYSLDRGPPAGSSGSARGAGSGRRPKRTDASRRECRAVGRCVGLCRAARAPPRQCAGAAARARQKPSERTVRRRLGELGV